MFFGRGAFSKTEAYHLMPYGTMQRTRISMLIEVPGQREMVQLNHKYQPQVIGRRVFIHTQRQKKICLYNSDVYIIKDFQKENSK